MCLGLFVFRGFGVFASVGFWALFWVLFVCGFVCLSVCNFFFWGGRVLFGLGFFLNALKDQHLRK